MRILMLSSWVARGHVGLSAGAPVLQILGHEVTQLPTVLLSNHPGFAQTSGRPVATDQLAGMIDALDANGWLASQDALLTGYLPTPEHVALACHLIARLRRHGRPRVIVDPVLGDHPKGLYLPGAVADDLRDRLAPQADTLTPNAFELGWLTGLPTDTPRPPPPPRAPSPAPAAKCCSPPPPPAPTASASSAWPRATRASGPRPSAGACRTASATSSPRWSPPASRPARRLAISMC
ncbi:bifunctional hydroxymethylpyrimidine kinase/phosphomethylpyrimidine kinase [Seohaeicola zhoushanensis]